MDNVQQTDLMLVKGDILPVSDDKKAAIIDGSLIKKVDANRKKIYPANLRDIVDP